MATVGKTVAYLGIEWHVEGSTAEGNGAHAHTTHERIIVRRVISNSPAAKAGMREGDLLLAVDGVPLDNQVSLSKIITTRRPGAVIQVSYSRSEKIAVIKITLGERQLPAFKFKPIEEAKGRLTAE